jgi:excisionase family DNA binding protein
MPKATGAALLPKYGGAVSEQQEVTYLTPSQAARILHVSPKTVDRWADQGRIPCVVTLGGHRRFAREAVLAVADQMAAKGVVSEQ